MMDINDLSKLISTCLIESKAIETQIIDVRELTDITDQMIICHGTSVRHVAALAQKVIQASQQENNPPASIEGEELKEWILIDYIDIVVHIMKRETREYYDLESLWDVRLSSSSAHSA